MPRCPAILLAVTAAIAVTTASAANTANADGAPAAARAAELEAVLRGVVAAADGIPGALLTIRTPAFSWSGAAGRRALPDGPPLQAGDEFRIASVTKIFTAAAILRLVEQGRLGLDDPIDRHLAADELKLLRADRYDTARITVRHLLEHSSGIHDFATDARFLAAVAENPARRWTRREQLALAVAAGQPYGPPGRQSRYSDTGYILLGAIIERISGAALADAMPALLRFEALGLARTRFEPEAKGLVDPIPADRAHQYMGTTDVTILNPSFDLFGGGGLLSTTGDLATFLDALFANHVFDRPATLQRMLTVSPGVQPDRDGSVFALGIERITANGGTCWRHLGFWGTQVVHCPVPGVTAAYTVNAAGGPAAAAIAAIGKLLQADIDAAGRTR